MKIIFNCLLLCFFASYAYAQPDLEEQVRATANWQVKKQSEIQDRANSPLFVATINPLYQILLAITEDKNNSILLFDPHKSEHSYELGKNDVATLTKATFIFYIDDELEKNFVKLKNNYNLQYRSFEMSSVDGLTILRQKNNPAKTDYHLWLNPQNAIKIAEYISKKLCTVDLLNCTKYRNNYEKFSQNINITATNISHELEPYRNVGFVFLHDGYQYFEDYFDIKSLMALSYEGETEIGISAMRKFDNFAKAGRIRCIFGEVNDEHNSAPKLARKYLVNYLAINPLGMNDDSYNAMLNNLSDDFRECLVF